MDGNDLWHPPINGCIDAAIVGGESGPKARPCHIEWIRSVVRQCDEAGVGVHVKQLGARPVAGEVHLHEWPTAEWTGCGGGGGVAKLLDRSGADPSEWPEDFRRRDEVWER